VVTHELQSIFAIGDNSVFLDTNTRTMRAQGNPRELLKIRPIPTFASFSLVAKQNRNARRQKLPPFEALTYE